MIEKAKSEIDEKQKAEKQKHDEADDELGRELEDFSRRAIRRR